MDEKIIDLKALAIMLELFKRATKDDIDRFFDLLPIADEGPTLTRQRLHELADELFVWGFDKIKAEGVELPEVTEDDLNPPLPDMEIRNDVDFVFEMTHQHELDQGNYDCGFFFDGAELIIHHDEGVYKHNQSGGLMIKQKPHRIGRFKADLSSIPEQSQIISVKLIMRLNRAEGIAYSDTTGVVKVTDGVTKDYIRNISAASDIHGKGYSKHNPNVPIDFTEYLQQFRKIKG